MNKLLFSTIIVLIFGLSVIAVPIYNVSYSDSFSGAFNVNKTLILPQFDSSLGTLLSATIDFGVSANGTIGFENTTSSAIKRSLYTYFYMDDPVEDSTRGNLGLNFNNSEIADVTWDVREKYTLNLTAFDGTIDYAGKSGFSITYLDKSASGQLFYDKELSQFIGKSNLSFNLLGNAYSAMIMPGNGASTMRTLGQGNVKITYEYTIAEPATMSLFAIGALSLFRKKKL